MNKLSLLGALAGPLVAATLAGGCSSDDAGTAQPAPNADAAPTADAAPEVPRPDAAPSAEDEWVTRAKGRWLYAFEIAGEGGSIWVDDFVTIDRNRHDVSADIFADEARTIKLGHLDWAATLKVERGSLPDTFEGDIGITTATFTSFVDDPELWASLTLDDCNLVTGQAVDVKASNCVFPLTRNTTCAERELFELPAGSNELRNGTPETDHCAVRPITIDRKRAPYVRQPQ